VAVLPLALVGASTQQVDASPAMSAVTPSLHVVPMRPDAAPPAGGDQSAPRRAGLPRTETRVFSTVGITWLPDGADAGVSAEVRTRHAGSGRWSPWRRLPLEVTTIDRAAGSPPLRHGTAPLYVGPSNGVEARVDGRGKPLPRGLRVDLVDPGLADSDTDLEDVVAAGDASAAPAAIIPRAGWAADEGLRTCTPPDIGTPQVAFVSSAGAARDYSPIEAARMVRGIYGYQTLSTGWCDLGATFLVDRFGRIFAGRWSGASGTPLGAHTPGFDDQSIGVALLGLDRDGRASRPQAAGLAGLLAHELTRSYGDPSRGVTLTASHDGPVHARGARAVFSTISSPPYGTSLPAASSLPVDQLQRIRREVTLLMGAGLVAPRASAAVVQHDAGDVVVTAGVLRPQSWELTLRRDDGTVVRRVSGSARVSVEARWDLLDDAGAPVPPGRYALELRSGAGSLSALPWTLTVTVVGSGEDPEAPPPSTGPSVPPVVTPPPPSPPGPPHQERWSPPQGVQWQWQLQGEIDTSIDVPVYGLDGFTTSAQTVAGLRAQGRHAICYLSVGAWEDWRPDADRFPASVLGADNGWPGERWLDIRRLDLLAPVLSERIAMCRDKGFEAVEPDNVDAYVNDSGFPLTGADQLAFNRWVAAEVHRHGMSVGLKNDLDQVQELVDDFDFAMNEQCFEYSECDALLPFLRAGKAVLHVEYAVPAERFCGRVPPGFSSMQKRLDLGVWRRGC
jgi:hypothetical protein